MNRNGRLYLHRNSWYLQYLFGPPDGLSLFFRYLWFVLDIYAPTGSNVIAQRIVTSGLVLSTLYYLRWSLQRYS